MYVLSCLLSKYPNTAQITTRLKKQKMVSQTESEGVNKVGRFQIFTYVT